MGLSPQQQSAIMNEIKRLSRNKTQQTPIRHGDSVRDIEPGWPHYMETGTVAKIEGNKVLWKCDKSGEFLVDDINKLEKIWYGYNNKKRTTNY